MPVEPKTISSVASQNEGTARKAIAKLRATKSQIESCFIAESTPTGSAISSEKISARVPSSNVQPMRLLMSFQIGVFCSTDLPKSPRTRWPSQVTYCCTNGLSSPSWCVICAFCAAVPFSPRMTVSTPPGMIRTSVKTISVTPRIVGITSSSRRTKYAFTALLVQRDVGCALGEQAVIVGNPVVLHPGLREGEVLRAGHRHVVHLRRVHLLDLVDLLQALGLVSL